MAGHQFDTLLAGLEEGVDRADAVANTITQKHVVDAELLKHIGELRDILETVAQGDRDTLRSDFASNCDRVSRLRAVLDVCLWRLVLEASDLPHDQRVVKTCFQKCVAVEAILEDLGFAAALQAARQAALADRQAKVSTGRACTAEERKSASKGYSSTVGSPPELVGPPELGDTSAAAAVEAVQYNLGSGSVAGTRALQQEIDQLRAELESARAEASLTQKAPGDIRDLSAMLSESRRRHHEAEAQILCQAREVAQLQAQLEDAATSMHNTVQDAVQAATTLLRAELEECKAATTQLCAELEECRGECEKSKAEVRALQQKLPTVESRPTRPPVVLALSDPLARLPANPPANPQAATTSQVIDPLVTQPSNPLVLPRASPSQATRSSLKARSSASEALLQQQLRDLMPKPDARSSAGIGGHHHASPPSRGSHPPECEEPELELDLL